MNSYHTHHPLVGGKLGVCTGDTDGWVGCVGLRDVSAGYLKHQGGPGARRGAVQKEGEANKEAPQQKQIF